MFPVPDLFHVDSRNLDSEHTYLGRTVEVFFPSTCEVAQTVSLIELDHYATNLEVFHM